MGTAFSAAVDTLFNDPNLAVTATYTPKGGQPFVCQAIFRHPDAMSRLADGLEVVSRGTQITVRISEVANPGAGDVVTIGSANYTVQGVPKHADAMRLTWLLDTHP